MCEYKKKAPVDCTFTFMHRTRFPDLPNVRFTGVMKGGDTRAVFVSSLPKEHLDSDRLVFRTGQQYSVTVQCGAMKSTGVYQPVCTATSEAPEVSCDLRGMCHFKGTPHKILGANPDVVDYKYRLRSMVSGWGPMMTARGPADGLTVDINNEGDRILSTLNVPLTDDRMQIEVSVWYVDGPGNPTLNKYADVTRHTWRP